MSRKNNLYKVTIELTGIESDVNSFIALASRFGVATREAKADTKAAKASKPAATSEETLQDIVNTLSSEDKKLVANFKKAGCIGYISTKAGLKPLASYDNKNHGYRYCETTPAGTARTEKGKPKSVYNDSEYKAAKAANTKFGDGWKLRLYRELGYYVAAKDEKNITLF